MFVGASKSCLSVFCFFLNFFLQGDSLTVLNFGVPPQGAQLLGVPGVVPVVRGQRKEGSQGDGELEGLGFMPLEGRWIHPVEK